MFKKSELALDIYFRESQRIFFRFPNSTHHSNTHTHSKMKNSRMKGSGKSARDKTKAGIVSLIKALHEHRKFKRMCVYSLKAILKSLMPPNTDWERNILLFCENGGIKGVVKILERYPGDGDILEDCAAILAQVPKPRPQGPTLCWQLAKDGAIVDTLKSMANNSHLEKGVRHAMEMVQNVSKCNARAFVSNPENLDGVFKIVDIFPGRPDVVCPASHTYEAVCRRKKTARVFVERGGLPRLIKMLNCKGSDADAVRLLLSLSLSLSLSNDLN